jgi:hypothetical protein
MNKHDIEHLRDSFSRLRFLSRFYKVEITAFSIMAICLSAFGYMVCNLG